MTTEVTMSTNVFTGKITNHPQIAKHQNTIINPDRARILKQNDIDISASRSAESISVDATENTIHYNHNQYWQRKETNPNKYRYKLGLVRSLGNALPPRHDSNQTLRNLEFLLRHEPAFENSVHKHWILNRIVDDTLLQQLENLFREYKQSITILPFKIKEYESTPYLYQKANEKVLGSTNWRNNADLIRKQSFWEDKDKAKSRREYLDVLYNSKNLYVTNQNNARNFGIDYYAATNNYIDVDYILSWDGNCFLTQAGHDLLHQELEHHNDEQKQHFPVATVAQTNRRTTEIDYHAPIKYFYTPMDRITDKNEALLDPNTYRPTLKEEPQIVMHRTAIARFDPSLRYGFKNKVDLLQKLQIKGSWNKPNTTYPRPKDYNLHQNKSSLGVVETTPSVGWVTRLFSGKANLEGYNLATARGNARTEGIKALCQDLDVRAVTEVHYDAFKGFDHENTTINSKDMSIAPYLFYNEKVLQKEARDIDEDDKSTPLHKLFFKLIDVAESSLRSGPWSVVDKQRCGCPYNKCQEYYNVKPYPWPTTPTIVDGLETGTKGNNSPDANGCNDSDNDSRYDRRRLAEFQSNTTVLGLAYTLTGNIKYATKAAENIRTWFVNPKTRMNPRLKEARIRWKGRSTTYFSSKFSVIDFKDVYFFLDAVKMVERSGELSEEDRVGIRKWFRKYLEWFTFPGKKFGRGAYYDDDHNGLYYDIQLISIAAFVGNLSLAVQTAHESVSRLNGHINRKGRMDREIENGPLLCEHSQMFTLQGWVTLARLVSSMGINLWRQLPMKAGFKSKRWKLNCKLCVAVEYAVPLLRGRDSCDYHNNTLDETTTTIKERDDTRWWPIYWSAQWNCPHLETPYPFFVQPKWISNIGRSPPDSHYSMQHMYYFSSNEYEDTGIAPFWNLGLL